MVLQNLSSHRRPACTMSSNVIRLWCKTCRKERPHIHAGKGSYQCEFCRSLRDVFFSGD